MSSHRLIIGCGYLGYRLALLWKKQGDLVSAVTRSPHRAEHFRQAGLEPILADVMQPESLKSLPTAATTLYAVGFDRHATHSKRDLYVRGLQNVLQQLHPPATRLIYVSSTSVYGQSNGDWVDESSPTSPTEDSGRICLDAESLLSALESPWNRHATIVRLSGIYGPDRLIARRDALLAHEPLNLNPDAWLNLIHVDDAARIISLLADHTAAFQPHPSSPQIPVWLASDSLPLLRREFYSEFARLIHAPPPRFNTPPNESSLLNKRCSNRRLLDSFSLTLNFPTIYQGLPHALSADINGPG